MLREDWGAGWKNKRIKFKSMKSRLRLGVVVLLLTNVLLSSHTVAQSNMGNRMIGFSPGLLSKVEVKLEQIVMKRFSIGALAGVHYGRVLGVKLDPFARMYFGNTLWKGVYLQGKLTVGNVRSNRLYEQLNQATHMDWTGFYGAGFGAGYQFVLEQFNSSILDIQIGYQLLVTHQRLPNYEGSSARDFWKYYVSSPIGAFDNLVSVGFSF